MRSFIPFRLIRRCFHVKSWHLSTSPGSTLRLRLPLHSEVQIRELDPLSSNWNEAKIDLSVLPHDNNSISTSNKEDVLNDLQPIVEAEGKAVHVQLKELDTKVGLNLLIPGKFDLDAELEKGNLEMQDTLEGDVRVSTEAANVKFHKVKGMNIEIHSGKGSISAGVLQGDARLRTRQGNIYIRRMQGPSVRMDSTEGNIEADAVYSNKVEITSQKGFVRIKGLQGDAKVQTDGKVELGGVEGDLDVEGREVELNLSVPKRVRVRSAGDVNLGLSESLRGDIAVDGKVRWEGIDGDRLGEGEASIHVKAQGQVTVRKMGWGDSLWFSRRPEVAMERDR